MFLSVKAGFTELKAFRVDSMLIDYPYAFAFLFECQKMTRFLAFGSVESQAQECLGGFRRLGDKLRFQELPRGQRVLKYRNPLSPKSTLLELVADCISLFPVSFN